MNILPITADEFGIPRSACEYIDWVDNHKLMVSQDEELITIWRLNKDRLVKVFKEEALPLAKFLKAKFSGRSDIKITHMLGSQSYDAEFQCEDDDLKYVEVTDSIMDEDERARMEILDREGTVPYLAKVKKTATKHRGGKAYVDKNSPAVFSYNELTTCAFEKVARVVDKKIGNHEKYEESTALLVSFDDMSVVYKHECDFFRKSIAERYANVESNFSWLFLIGVVRGTFYEFCLKGKQPCFKAIG